MDTSEHVTVWPVNVDEDWFDYETFLLQAYKKLRSAKIMITKNHIFSATVEGCDDHTFKFFARISNMTEHPEQHGAIQRANFAQQHERKESLLSMQPEKIVYKGLPGYKQVLMHKNYTSFVPKHYHTDLLYRKPSKEVLEAEELDQKHRREYKKKHKKMKTVEKTEV